MFTENAAFEVSISVDGSGNSNFTTTKLAANGCVASGSIVKVDNGLIYLGRDGIYFLGQIEGFETSLLSRKISEDIAPIIDDIKPNNLSKAVAGFWKDRYKLSIPTGESTINNTELVFTNLKNIRGWTKSSGKSISGAYERFVDSSDNSSEKFYFGGQDGVYEDEQGFDDDTFQIQSIIQTKDFGGDIQAIDKKWALCHI